MKTLNQYRKELIARFGRTEARTVKGLVSFWKSNRRPVSVLQFKPSRDALKCSCNMRRTEYEEAEKTRKSQAEEKRAKYDKKFRNNWVKRLKRKVLPFAKPIESAQQYVEWRLAAHEINSLNVKITKLGGIKVSIPDRPAMVAIERELSDKDKKHIRQRIGGRALDVAQWCFDAGWVDAVVAHVYNESGGTKRRGFYTKQQACHKILYQSFGVVVKGGMELSVLQNGNPSSFTLPEGYIFGADSEGLKIVRQSDGRDFHPFSGYEELKQPLSQADVDTFVPRMLVLDAARDRQIQEEAEKQRLQALFDQDARNTRVTLQDSLYAGNCRAGSLSFGQRLGYDPQDFNGINAPGVRASSLLRTKDPRARNASWAAWKRETLVCI